MVTDSVGYFTMLYQLYLYNVRSEPLRRQWTINSTRNWKFLRDDG